MQRRGRRERGRRRRRSLKIKIEFKASIDYISLRPALTVWCLVRRQDFQAGEEEKGTQR